MLDKKNQDGPQEDLDDILKDFDEQDELHQRIQEFKKKKEASSAQQEELKERGQIQEEPEEAKTAIEQLKAMQEEKKETEELEQTKVSVIPRQEKAPEEEPAEDEANATVIISEDEMKRLVEEEERQKQDKKAEKKKKKKKSSVGAEVSEEEASRFNKIITIVIAAVVVIGIIIGIIFAVVSTGGDDGTDKSRLENLITQVEELDQNDYTEDEWTALQNALKEAKAVFDDEDATQDAVDEAYNATRMIRPEAMMIKRAIRRRRARTITGRLRRSTARSALIRTRSPAIRAGSMMRIRSSRRHSLLTMRHAPHTKTATTRPVCARSAIRSQRCRMPMMRQRMKRPEANWKASSMI